MALAFSPVNTGEVIKAEESKDELQDTGRVHVFKDSHIFKTEPTKLVDIPDIKVYLMFVQWEVYN